MLWPLKDRQGRKAGTPAGYQGDSGLDIACPMGTTVIAPANGWIEYSEGLAPGKQDDHTPWGPPNHPNDTPGCILFRLAEPVQYRGRAYPLLWFAHMRKLAFLVPDGSPPRFISQGTSLGETGRGNNVPHLHFGILIARSQGPGEYMLPEDVLLFLRSQPIAPPRHDCSIIVGGRYLTQGEIREGKAWGPLAVILSALNISYGWRPETRELSIGKGKGK